MRQDQPHDLVVVISDLGSGGAQRVVVQLVEAWQRSGRRTAVITLSDPESDFFRLPVGTVRIALSSVKRSRHWLQGLLVNIIRVKRLRAALRSARAPIAIAFIMPTSVLTLLASRGLGISVIACERNDPQRQSFGSVWTLLRRITYHWADVVTANSRDALSFLSAFVPPRKLLYVANPIPPLPESIPVRLERHTLLTVGRLHRQKAQDVLLKAFAQFLKLHSEWQLAVIGEGPQEASLRALAEQLGIQDRVDWLGLQPDPYPWLRSARIFALPSRYEGMPNALLEAMSCGLPCIVSNASPGPLDLVKQGITGLVVPVEDDHALAAALHRLASDPELSRRLGEAARNQVQAHALTAALPSWEAAIERARIGIQ